MIQKDCQNCGNLYKVHPYRKDSKFCSKDCHYDSKREDRICLNCESTFVVKKSRQDKYCSQGCYQKHNTIINRVDCACEQCGEIFSTPKNNLKRDRGKYCSKECVHDSYRIGECLTCKECGDEFYRSNAHIKFDSNFCSESCYGKNKELYPKTKRIRHLVRIKQDRLILGDTYVKKLIKSLTTDYIPKELIELKRLNIKRKRKIKEITHGNSQ